MREVAEREAGLLRISNLLAEAVKSMESTKRQLSSVTDNNQVQLKELENLKIAYEAMCQLKATADYERSAAISERDVSMREKEMADEEIGRGLKALAALEGKMATETKLFESKLNELV